MTKQVILAVTNIRISFMVSGTAGGIALRNLGYIVQNNVGKLINLINRGGHLVRPDAMVVGNNESSLKTPKWLKNDFFGFCNPLKQ